MLDRLAYTQSLPKKRLGAGCLCFNERGQVLLVKPVYKPVWEIPGGVVELDESPKVCCQREMREELGLEREAGALLVVDYIHATQEKTEALMFIFNGGVLSEGEIASIRLPQEELSEFGFFGIDTLPAEMSHALRRRVLAAWRQSSANQGIYLENHEPIARPEANLIVIHDAKVEWPQEFDAIHAALLEVMGSLALRIDHIGSTSVPGLGAKDVIDIQITVHALTPEIKEKLIAAGYVDRASISQDHVPPGEDEDSKLWAKFMFVQPSGQRRTNVHVRVAGNPNQRYAILFRDYLRAHPNSARTIERIKREIARRHAGDSETYYDIKDPVYDLIWEAAQEWARQSGWQLS